MPFPKSCLYSRCCDGALPEFDCFECVSRVLDHNNHVGLSVSSDPLNEEVIFTVAGGAGTVAIGQSLFVSDSLGSDISGTPNRLDLPYKTIQGALNDWTPNSTIFVFPGTYGLSAPITTPGADILRIHFFNGAQVNSLPEDNIFIVRGGFYCTGHGVFNSAGSGFGSHAPFWISPSSSGTVYIEAEYIVGSVHGLYIDE